MNPQATRVTPQAHHRLAQAQVVDGSVEWPGEIALSFATLSLPSVPVRPQTPA